MTSTAVKAPIETIYISDDESNDCLINHLHSHLISGIEANGSDNKGHCHDLQGKVDQQETAMSMDKVLWGNFSDICNVSHTEVVSRSELTNQNCGKTTEVSAGVTEKNSGEMSSLSKYQSPVESFDVYISTIDGISQLFDIISYKALVTANSSNDGSLSYPSTNIASLQDIAWNHQSNLETYVEDSKIEEDGKTPRPTKPRKRIVSAEECDTCSPPFHTCKRFGNVTANFTSNFKNIKPNKLAEVKPIEIYRCQACSKAFTKKWVLVRHQLIHENPETWNKCPFCTYKTPYTTSMKLHLKNHKVSRTIGKTKIDLEKVGKTKAKRIPFWQCTYCQKKFQLAEYCERHELRCRDEDRGKLLKVFAGRLRRDLSEAEKSWQRK